MMVDADKNLGDAVVDRETEQGFLFRWKYKSVPNPSSRFAARVRHLTLLCNRCDAPVISGAPYNLTGQRYFTYYANQAALEHAATHSATTVSTNG